MLTRRRKLAAPQRHRPSGATAQRRDRDRGRLLVPDVESLAGREGSAGAAGAEVGRVAAGGLFRQQGLDGLGGIPAGVSRGLLVRSRTRRLAPRQGQQGPSSVRMRSPRPQLSPLGGTNPEPGARRSAGTRADCRRSGIADVHAFRCTHEVVHRKAEGTQVGPVIAAAVVRRAHAKRTAPQRRRPRPRRAAPGPRSRRAAWAERGPAPCRRARAMQGGRPGAVRVRRRAPGPMAGRTWEDLLWGARCGFAADAGTAPNGYGASEVSRLPRPLGRRPRSTDRRDWEV